MTDLRDNLDLAVEKDNVEDPPSKSTIIVQEARRLADLHEVVRQTDRRSLVTASFVRYTALFTEAVKRLRGAGENEVDVIYASEWMLDNDYLIFQSLRQIKENLPPDFERQLPQLSAGPHAGLPRVYSLAEAIVRVRHTRLEISDVEAFLEAYQEASPLTMGEIWALPVMLRLNILHGLALTVAELTQIEIQPSDLPLPPIEWPVAITPEEVIAGSFTSLRAIAAQDWRDFFEHVSLVERVLSNDPAGFYRQMDFETRDQYRKVVEELSLDTGISEEQIAREAIALAKKDDHLDSAGITSKFTLSTDYKPKKDRHIGFYLIDRGRPILEAKVNYQLNPMERLDRFLFAHPNLVYLGSIWLIAFLLWLLSGLSILTVGGSFIQLAVFSLASVAPILTVIIVFVNWLLTNLLKPRVLPKMDYSKGVPEGQLTLIVVPTLLSSLEEVDSLLEQIELHYLRNSDPYFYFALLSDFVDAPSQKMDGDEEIIGRARAGIEELNRKYPQTEGGRFLLLHRERCWNPSERSWIGWERKRGKLQELNQLILNSKEHVAREHKDRGPNGFQVKVGNLKVLPEIRFVITLDADTILPPGSASRLAATLAHPLNRAEFNAQGKVIAGYTVLQPRTEINPVRANQTHFTQIFSGDTGLDLYTLAVSDTYQDLFGEGSYTGKGIYDVRAFHASLEGKIPENILLSHDLIEGLFGRAGLVSDIVLIEDYPASYMAHTRRMLRWIRGDWQLLPWLLPLRSMREGRTTIQKNSSTVLGPIDYWKILDNLRRSLLAPSLLSLLLMSWLALIPGSPALWTALSVMTLAAPLATEMITSLFQLSMARFTAQALSRSVVHLRTSIMRWLLVIVFLPYEALLALRAIVITLIRMYVTRQNLLRWTTSAQAERRYENGNSRLDIWNEMKAAPLLAIVAALVVGLVNPGVLPTAAPLLVLWLVSPEIALFISQPRTTEVRQLDEREQQRLRSLARRTWLFFEQFVGPEDHWLPPDNYQESPLGTVAHRTSPTNIGLGMLATLGAYDLGYIDLLVLAARLRNSFDTLSRLERYRGHFLNWYDTLSQKPLPPRYVSTVDSGNLAACLITLRQGLQELPNTCIVRWEALQGVHDAFALLFNTVENLKLPGARVDTLPLEETLRRLLEEIQAVKDKPQEWADVLLQLKGPAGWQQVERQLLDLIETGSAELSAASFHHIRLFSQQVRTRLEYLEREMEMLHPWVKSLQNPPSLLKQVPPPEIVQAWKTLNQSLSVSLTLEETGRLAETVQEVLSDFQETTAQMDGLGDQREELHSWTQQLLDQIQSASLAAKALLVGYDELIRQAETYFKEMDFRFLYNRRRHVFHIGYNLEIERLDANYYDLLASEARIASLVAIAKGEIPQKHWLHMARPLTQINGRQVLLSWSATAFEYLMPMLFARNYEGTLLWQSTLGSTDVQIEYGQKKNVPWGISESGFYHFDLGLSYQYRAFGVPGLGYKRGLADDLVIAPYASLLALPLRPKRVVKNIADLIDLGALGPYGFYEAVDFTPARLLLGDRYQLVREYMAHHQSMIFLSILNFLSGDLMVRRFHDDPLIQSVELLLQEKIPPEAPLEEAHTEESHAFSVQESADSIIPWQVNNRTSQPRLNFLSNGRYGVMITAAGSGYSTWQEKDLTRWRADTTLEEWGTWIYIQDLESGDLWSTAHLPTGTRADNRTVSFQAHMATFALRNGEISSTMEVTIAPEDDVEIRLITLTNHGSHPHRLRLTSYAEVVMAAHSADRRQPAFNKLFIESEYISGGNALLYRRRPRSEKEETFYLAHAVAVQPGVPLTRRYEGDRARFLGRLQNSRAPLALTSRDWLTGTVGPTLDPVMAMGQEIVLKPRATVQIAFLTLAAEDQQHAKSLAERYQSWPAVERNFGQARRHTALELSRLGLTSNELPVIQHILSGLLFPHEILRAPIETLSANQKGQPDLWAYGISADYPILLAKIDTPDDLTLVKDLLKAHAYWRNRDLKIDLVLINEQGTNYGQELQGNLGRLLVRTGNDAWLNRRGGIFTLMADRLSREDRVLLETAARVVLEGKRGSLAGQLPDMDHLPARLPAFTAALQPGAEDEPTPPLLRPADLLFDNGHGGFSPDGKEYLIYLEAGKPTPLPWINVIANPSFGCLATEAGLGYSWAENSGENRLTPWSNDPVSDPSGEAVYLRDEETAEVWSPTPLPAGEAAPYLVKHGAGYTKYEHNSHGLKQHVRVFAIAGAPVKVIQVRLENTWTRPRRLTVTYYAEWVLGVNREETQQFIVTDFEGDTQALLVRNTYNSEFSERTAFAAASKKLHGLTADRTEFFGRLGDRALPAALTRIGLASTIRPGLDPCAALQLHIDLPPGENEEVYFLLGEGQDREDALRLVKLYQDQKEVTAAWDEVVSSWDAILGAVQVRTPDPAMDVLLNRWLLYQSLSCRIWGRSAFYQSSGAYGFRDQLQDVMSLTLTAPHIAREHLLRAARHQFEAGDVLHWWHPPSGRGIRTRFSDDLLWLPFVVGHYVTATGDMSVLDELEPFVQGEMLEPDQEERYGHYPQTRESYSLYEHCLKAIEKGHTSGPHDLPLMGTGDWNDGMNRVGVDGRGESVWLAWFLIKTLKDFAQICDRRGDGGRAGLFRQRAADLIRAVETHAWDGAWYLRAFYDDGSPLGSANNRECQIDSIAQSWGILSDAADPQRAAKAMQSVAQRLVRPEDRLILLFTPPFNKTPRDPGYIKGYLPGIRENGGQYTHAAIWAVWAYTRLGQGDEAGRLFNLLNPIYQADTPAKVQRYRVEPYVVAADIYSVPPHVGRGGWTWYTGSAGWLYRLGLEAVLGLRREGQYLVIDPCIPQNWQGYRMTVIQENTRYEIEVDNPFRVSRGVKRVSMDGELLPEAKIPLEAQGRDHHVLVTMGPT